MLQAPLPLTRIIQAISLASTLAIGDLPLSADAETSGDVFCGPRCTQFILACYGHHVELHSMIEEVQDVDWSRGSSLASVERALAKRGVKTRAIRLERESVLKWDGLAIVLLENSPGNPLGHFVVQLPSTADGFTRLWCSLAGIQEISDLQLARSRSEIVLLTSRDEIELPVQLSSGFAALTCLLAVITVATEGAFCAAPVRRFVSAKFTRRLFYHTGGYR